MTLIQIILLTLILLLTIVYILFFKSKTINRILFITTFLMGMVFVLLPNLTNRIANFIGVGRGADLLLYAMVILFYATFLYVYARLRKIEVIQTEIIRGLAIRNAGKPKEALEKEK